MAGAAQTLPVQAVALRTLISPSTTQDATDAIEQQGSPQQGPGGTQQASNNVHTRATVQQSATATPQHSPPSHSAPCSPSVPAPVPCPDDSDTGPICRFLRDTPIGNAIGLIGLVLALGFGLFTGITGYRDMKWSEHANAVQTCASLYSIGYFSDYCNSTIEGGIETTPLLRRMVKSTTDDTSYRLLLGMSPFALASAGFCTITAISLGLIFTRPRMQSFAPVISNVRLELTRWIPGPRCITHSPGSKLTAETLLLIHEELSKEQNEVVPTSRPSEVLVHSDLPPEASRGRSVGSNPGEQEEDNVSSGVLSSASSEILSKVQPVVDPLHPVQAEDTDELCDSFMITYELSKQSRLRRRIPSETALTATSEAAKRTAKNRQRQAVRKRPIVHNAATETPFADTFPKSNPNLRSDLSYIDTTVRRSDFNKTWPMFTDARGKSLCDRPWTENRDVVSSTSSETSTIKQSSLIGLKTRDPYGIHRVADLSAADYDFELETYREREPHHELETRVDRWLSAINGKDFQQQ